MYRILLQKDTLTPLRQAQPARLPLCHRYGKGRTSRFFLSTIEAFAGQIHSHGITRNFLCLGALVAYRTYWAELL